MPERARTASPTDRVQVQRYVFLDGLRGWGAVVVLLFHYLVQVFPPSAASASVLRRLLFFNGSMAVWVFFVVSGFSLSIGYVERHDARTLARLAIGRYPRLAIPVFSACSLVHLMMMGGVIYPVSARPDALKPFLSFDPTLPHLFRFALLDVFRSHSLFDSYIPPLWTMSIELIGSAMVIALLALCGRAAWRRWAYAALTLVLAAFASFYTLFVAGMLLAELYSRGLPDTRWSRALLIVGLAAGFVVPIFYWNGLPGGPGLLGIICFCSASMFLVPLRRFFELPLSRWLGRISFPLYLVHAPLAYSLCLYLVRQLTTLGWTQATTNIMVVAVSVPSAILAAWLFTPINEFAIAMARRLGKAGIDGWDWWVRPHKPEIIAPLS